MDMQKQADSLSPERMQLFVAGLSGLAPEEVRKAKTLYIRNAIAEYDAMNETLKSFGCLHMAFALVPVFWPVIYLQRKMINTGRRLMAQRIQNALDVWQDDLAGERFDFRMED